MIFIIFIILSTDDALYADGNESDSPLTESTPSFDEAKFQKVFNSFFSSVLYLIFNNVLHFLNYFILFCKTFPFSAVIDSWSRASVYQILNYNQNQILRDVCDCR